MSTLNVSIYLLTNVESDKITLEYEINNVVGINSIPFNRNENVENQEEDLTEKALSKISPYFSTDPSDLSIEEVYEYGMCTGDFTLEKLESFTVEHKEEIPDKVLQIRDNLKETNPEIFL